MNASDEIKRLYELHQAGALTDEEFAQAKAKVIAAIGSEKPYGDASAPISRLNRFRRSVSDRWLGGVCGGLGASTAVEAWIWRVLFVLFTLYFGFGALVYILAWIFVPEEQRQ
jgi:phage shock protein C